MGEISLENLLSAIIESAPDAMVVTNHKGIMMIVNAQTEKFFGYTSAELIGQPIEMLIPDRFKSTHENQRDHYSHNPSVRPMGSGLDLFGKRKNGTEFPVDISLSPLKTEEGVWIIAEIRDITERKIAENKIKSSLKEKEVLLKEIHHRVKNNLQIISSLLSLEARRLEDEKMITLLQECQNRVRSMSLIHEKLYQSQNLSQINFSEYLQGLISNLAASYKIDSNLIQFDISSDQVNLNIDMAIPLGLIINELVSNSLKHAFPDGRSGSVKVSLKSTNDMINLEVSNDGVSLPKDLDISKTKTLGLQIVNALCQQIDGKLSVNSAHGTSFRITFKGQTA